MEDNLKCKRAQWKMTLMEDDLNGRRPQWKTTSMEDSKMEDNLNGRRRTSIEQDLNGR